jgi:hypothetical protein
MSCSRIQDWRRPQRGTASLAAKIENPETKHRRQETKGVDPARARSEDLVHRLRSSGIETVARSSVETAAQKLRKMITDRRTMQRTKKNRDLTADVGSRAKTLKEELKTRHKTQSKELSSTRNL